MTAEDDQIVKVPRPDVSAVFGDARPQDIEYHVEPSPSGRSYEITIGARRGYFRGNFARALTLQGARRKGERMANLERRRLQRRADRRRELGLE